MKRTIIGAALAGLAGLAGCTDPALEQRVADLEIQVNNLNERVAAAPAPGARPERPERPGGANTEEERAANELFRTATDAANRGDYAAAQAALAQLNSEYGTTRTARRAERLANEVGVIGQDAGELDVSRWFHGQASMNDGRATLLVFWELWCPHCKRAMPQLEETYQRHRADGLNVIALTKVTRSATEPDIEEYIREHNLTYPSAREQGSAMSERFAVRGVPAAAMVKDGKVVWRGHPNNLSDEMIRGWLGN